MSNMKVPPPDGGSKGSGKAEGQQPKAPQGDEFSRVMREMEGEVQPGESQPSSPLQPKQKEKEKKKEKPKEKSKGKVEQQAGQTKQDVPVQLRAGATTPSTQMSSQIEKIAAIFRANPVYGATVQQITATPTETGANIMVSLSNGVMVNINLTGTSDINVSVTGVSEAAQAAMANKDNQNFLRGQLQQAGFTLHKLETFRSEAPQTETRGDTGEGKQEKEEEEQG